MKNKQIMVLIGPSGCGKTTFAKNYIKDNPGWVRVNRDEIRSQMLGPFNMNEYFAKDNAFLEKHVTNLQNEQTRYWLGQNMNVIIDNTHLQKKYITTYIDLFGHEADIIFTPITSADVNQCKDRVLAREGAGFKTDYIDRHFQNFNTLLKENASLFNVVLEKRNPIRSYFESFVVTTKGPCIIVDIDGTVADCHGIRSAYDGEKLHLDRPITEVRYILNKLKAGFFSAKPKIIYLSGREEKWRDGTIQWLKDNNFPYDGLFFMRKDGDPRADHIVKTELLFKHIAGKYKVLMSFDDRHQVVHNVWYKLGIFCLNVNQGLKIF